MISGLVFASIVLSIWGAMHYYVWRRLVGDTALPGPVAPAATALVVVLGLLPIVAMTHVLPKAIARPVWTGAFVWMGTVFLLNVTLGAGDLVRLFAGGESGFVAFRQQALASFVAAAALSAFAFARAKGVAPIRDVEVVLEHFPPAMSGFRIVQVSDLHVSPDTPPAKIQALVDRINATSPDLVVLTGDLVDGSPRELREGVAPLGKLSAPHGVYFVTGNHEYYSGADRWIQTFQSLGFRVLMNERVAIGKDDAAFDLAGVPDWHGANAGPSHAPQLEKALQGRDPSREVVLLAHQPRQFAQAARLGVGLQLSGHTHGGQLFPFTLLVALFEPYLAGLKREGRSQLYVSRGTGYWGPPMRLLAPSEITRITLRAPGA